MCRTNFCRVMITCCTAAVLLAAPAEVGPSARCGIGCSATDKRPTRRPIVRPPFTFPPRAACGCAPAQCVPAQPACPSCQSCAPATTYRISYRPVATVAYMPVVGIDPCSGCPVTTYRPTRAWTYQASLLPYSTYRVGYAPVAVDGPAAVAAAAPVRRLFELLRRLLLVRRALRRLLVVRLLVMRRLFVVRHDYGGCSSCNAGVSGGYGTSGGCSSCAAESGAVGRHAVARSQRHESAAGCYCPRPPPRAGDDRPPVAGGARFFTRTGQDLRPRRHRGPDLAECAAPARHLPARLFTAQPPARQAAPSSPCGSRTSRPSTTVRNSSPDAQRPRSRERESHDRSTGLAGHLLPTPAIAAGSGPGTMSPRRTPVDDSGWQHADH